MLRNVTNLYINVKIDAQENRNSIFNKLRKWSKGPTLHRDFLKIQIESNLLIMQSMNISRLLMLPTKTLQVFFRIVN